MGEGWLTAALELATPEVAEAVKAGFIKVEGNSITVRIQSGPLAHGGEPGAEFTALIGLALGHLKFLDRHYSCRENSLAKTKLEEALHWQQARTQDRERRGVEGKNEQ